MTHEHPKLEEAAEGPEHTHHLPDAGDVPVFENPVDSFLPPLDEDLED